MKIKLIINEPGNFFHVLDSLSEWDIHARKSLKKYYEERYPLSGSDKKLLKQYIKIRKRHAWKKLDSDFYPSKTFNEVNKNLQKRLTEKELLVMKTIIKKFKPSIEKIYQVWEDSLKKRKKSIQNYLKKSKIDKALSDLSKFYNSDKKARDIYVYLLINVSQTSSGGGANIKQYNHITLEPYKQKEKIQDYVKHDVSILLHESIHIIERENSKWRETKKTFQTIGDKYKIIHESIADCLFPIGFLGEKYGLVKRAKISEFNNIKILKKDNERRYYLKFRNKLSAILFPIVKEQFNNGRNVNDPEFVERCIIEFKKLIKEVNQKTSKKN